MSDTPLSHGWHLRKEVNVSHILTTIMLVAGLITWGNKMDVRVSVLEDFRKEQALRDERQEVVLRDTVLRIEKSIDKLNEKLDKLIVSDYNAAKINGKR